MNLHWKLPLAALAAALLSGSAMAADLSSGGPTGIDIVSPWQVRLRALGVLTQDSGSVDGVAGSDVSSSNSVIPELDISYYFNDNIAAELILGTTRSHIRGEGTLAGVDVGKTWLLPPTLTLQYHFTNFGAFKPYVGAGVNYTMFYSQKAAGGTVTDLNVKNTFGAALQVGADYMINDHWGLNVDVKKLYLRPDFELNGGALTGKAKLDPWLVGAGLTYRF